MTDIAAQLRNLNPWEDPRWPEVLREGADEIDRLRAALRFYACDCKPECKCGLEYYSGVTYCGHTARKALERKND